MEEIYTEKEIYGDALATQKSTTEHFNTFANECVHENVRHVFLDILSDEHKIQDEVFKGMHAKGFYPTPMAEDKKINEAKQKFSQSVGC